MPHEFARGGDTMKNKRIALFLALMMMLGVLAPSTATAGAINLERIAGGNRYETAVKISQREFTTSDNVVLASGENFADALAGGQLAVVLNAPILLTPSKNLDGNVKTEIERLKAKKVFILGGKNTISEAVENQVKAISASERISGNNRIETALKIIEKARSLGLSNDTIYADAYGFPDALAAGTLVAAKKYSLALSEKQNVPTITVGKELVLGGTSSLPLPGYLGERVAGNNRYETAFKLASYTYPGADFTSETVILVDGTNYPDALSAISVARSNSAPILLTNPKALDQETKQFILNKVSKVIVIGGKNSVSEDVVNELSVPSGNLTISAHMNDGSGRIFEIDTKPGLVVTPPEVKLNDHSLVGWNTKPDGTGDYIDFATKVHDKDIELYAIWALATNQFYFMIESAESLISIQQYLPSGPKQVVLPEVVNWNGNDHILERIGSNAFLGHGITDLFISRYIKVIDDQAFKDNSIIELTIPSTIKSIEQFAFENSKIEILHLPDNLTKLGNAAFYRNKIKKIEIPKSLKEIPYRAFATNGLEEVIINDGVEIIHQSAFGNNNLTSVKIPNSVKKVGPFAFDKNKIKTLELSNQLTVMRKNVFDKNQLESVVIPSSVTSIEEFAFSNNQLKGINLPINLTNIGNCAFWQNKIKKVEIPSGIKVLPFRVFANNELEELIINEGVEKIGESAFGFNKLTKVVIPDSVKEIGAKAFDFNQIKTLNLPKGIQVIKYGTFYNNQIETVEFPNSIAEIHANAFINNKIKEVNLPIGTIVDPNAFDPGVLIKYY